MSQRKVVKPRLCRWGCGELIGTASSMRFHAEQVHGQLKPKKVGNSIHPKAGGKR